MREYIYKVSIFKVGKHGRVIMLAPGPFDPALTS